MTHLYFAIKFQESLSPEQRINRQKYMEQKKIQNYIFFNATTKLDSLRADRSPKRENTLTLILKVK